MKQRVIDEIKSKGIIAIVRGQSKEDIFSIADALIAGGINCMEITYNAAKPETHVETANIIGELKKHYGDKLFVGAGTVLTAEQVEMTYNAGGQYIISPNVNKDVIAKTLELGMVSIPGAMTPTECEAAHEYGADFVKLFPTVSLGAGYIKAISAPLCHIDFLAVGGVTPENISDYVKAGVVGIGTGGDLIIKSAVDNKDFGRITQRAKEYVCAMNKAKGN